MLSNHIIFHNLLNLLSELSTDSVTDLLEPWGFDSVESLKNAIIETTGDLTRAVTKGHSEIVEEETEKLETLQRLLCDVSNIPRNMRPEFRSVSSQNETAGNDALSSLPDVRFLSEHGYFITCIT
jgi:hypothetical protein